MSTSSSVKLGKRGDTFRLRRKGKRSASKEQKDRCPSAPRKKEERCSEGRKKGEGKIISRRLGGRRGGKKTGKGGLFFWGRRSLNFQTASEEKKGSLLLLEAKQKEEKGKGHLCPGRGGRGKPVYPARKGS